MLLLHPSYYSWFPSSFSSIFFFPLPVDSKRLTDSVSSTCCFLRNKRTEELPTNFKLLKKKRVTSIHKYFHLIVHFHLHFTVKTLTYILRPFGLVSSLLEDNDFSDTKLRRERVLTKKYSFNQYVINFQIQHFGMPLFCTRIVLSKTDTLPQRSVPVTLLDQTTATSIGTVNSEFVSTLWWGKLCFCSISLVRIQDLVLIPVQSLDGNVFWCETILLN